MKDPSSAAMCRWGQRRRAICGLVAACATLLCATAQAQASQANRAKVVSTAGSSCEFVAGDSLKPRASLGSELQGQVAGLQIHEIDARGGAGSFVRLRGNNSTGSNEPIIYVDDVRVPAVQTSSVTRRALSVQSFLNGLDFVDPSEVARIEILRGPAATLLYGMDASSGVIRIYTKRGPKGGAGERDKVGCP